VKASPLMIKGGAVPVRIKGAKGTARVTVTCRGEAVCNGRVTLATGGRKGRAVKVRLGAGKTRTIPVKLTAAQVKSVRTKARRGAKPKAIVATVSTRPGAEPVSRRRTVNLKLAAR